MNNYLRVCISFFKKTAFTALFFLLAIGVKAATRTATTSGSWNSTATWGGAAVPVNNDDVIIPAGITVTYNSPTENPFGDVGALFTTTHSYIEVSGKLVFGSGTTYIRFAKSVKFLVKNGGEVNNATSNSQFWVGGVFGISTGTTLLMYIQSGGKFTVNNTPNNFFGVSEASVNFTSLPISSGVQTASFLLTQIPDDNTNGGVAVTTSGLTAPTPAAGAPTTVTSIAMVNSSPTNAATVNYTVTFGAAVSGLTASNFSLTTSGVTGATVGTPSGSGTSWTVPVNTGSGSGTISLNLANATGLTPGISTSLPFAGDTYTMDRSAPVVSQVLVPVNSTYGIGTALVVKVDYGEPVTVNTAGGTPYVSITLNTGGTVHAGYTSTSGNLLLFSYTVATGNVDNNGITIGANITTNGGTLTDVVGNNANLTLHNIASTTNVLVDGVRPTVSSINIIGDSPVNATSVNYAVTFSENVTNVDMGDFALTTTGGVTGSVNLVSGSGKSYTVTVNNITGDGTIRLDLNSSGTGIQDVAGNAIATGYISGQTYTISHVPAPSISYVTPKTFTNGIPIATLTPASSNIGAISYNTNKTVIATSVATGTTPAISTPTGIAVSGGIVYAVNNNGGSGLLQSIPTGISYGSGLNTPFNMGTDAAGNIYIADLGLASITKVTPAGVATAVGSGLNLPTGVAVDAAGNVYVSEVGNQDVVKIAAGTGTKTVLLSNLISPYDVDVDAAGNAYVVDSNVGILYKIPAGTATTVTDPNSLTKIMTGLISPTSVAVDASGNFFVACNNAQITELSNIGVQSTIATGLSAIFGVAVDGAGNVYASDNGSSTIYKIRPLGGFYISALLPAGLSFNGSNGAISGTATVNSPAKDYTVTGWNATASSAATLNIAIVSPTTISSLNRVTAATTNATSVQYTAIFGASVTGLTTGNFTLTTDPTISGAGITGISGSGTTYTITVNTGTGDGNITLNLANTTNIIPGVGTTLPFSGQTYLVDKTAPAAPSTPVLAAGSDSGTPTDNITNVTTPVLTGTAEDGSTVTLYDTNGSTVLGSGTATGGTWSITSLVLGDGSHTITAKATDAVGNTSVALSGLTVFINTTIPGVVVSAVAPIEETSSAFTLAYTNVTGSPDLYSIVTAPTNAMPGFSPLSNFSLNAPNPVSVPVPNSVHGTYDFILNVRNQASGNQSADIPFSVTVNTPPPPPTVTLTGVLTAFSSCAGGPSADQSFKIAGTNLTADVIINAPAGYEISKTAGSAYNSQLTLTQSAGVVSQQDIFVRITASATGTPAGDITITSTGVADQAETVSGTVHDLPVITLGAIAPVGPFATTFSIPYSGLSSGNFIYYISTGTHAMAGFSAVNGFTLNPSPISVNIPVNTLPDTYDFNLTILNTATSCTSAVIPFTLTVTPSSDAALASLSTTAGTITPAFDPATLTGYMVSVPNATSSTTVTPTADGPGTTIQVQVNGGGYAAVSSGTASGSLALNTGNNQIDVQVTAQDGTTQSKYSLVVNRGPSSYAFLRILSYSPAVVKTQVSGPDYKDFTATVNNDVTSMTVLTEAVDANATVKVNGMSVSPDVSSPPITLNVGANVINTVITAEDGVTKKTYSLTVTRLASANALATSISYSPTIKQTLVSGPDYRDYTSTVPYRYSSVTVTPVLADPTATVTVNNVAVSPGTASAPIALSVGDNIVKTVVTAGDGVTTKTYSTTITRALSTNALLQILSYTPPILKTEVSGADFRDYVSTVSNSVSTFSVLAVPQDNTATVTVNGVTVASGVSSTPIALVVGTNTINTVVTAGDGVTQNTYSITITRLASTNALANISYSPTINKTAVSGADYRDYTATVPYKFTSITVTPVTDDNTATVTVNNVAVTPGTASAPISLNLGDNVINTVVTAGDGTTVKTYSLTITRAMSTDALLSTLSYSPSVNTVTVSGADYRDYTATVANSVASIAVMPVTQDNTATVTVNNVAVESGNLSGAIALNVGANTINTVVTAQDGTTTNTYSIVITRLAPPSATSLYDEKLVAVAAPLRNPELVVHQNVSPNGDGRSDVLVIDGITTYPENTLQIMSRSGSLVYEAKGYDNTNKAFDGHANNGKLQQPGTYFYSLEYKDGNETKRKTGFIILKY